MYVNTQICRPQETSRYNRSSDYELFEGALTSQMPTLSIYGYVPMDVLGIWERRINIDLVGAEQVRKAWQEQYFSTGVGIGYDTTGDFQFKLDAAPILSLSKASTRRNGGVVLTSETYTTLGGRTFTNADRRYFGRKMTEEEALAGDNPQAQALRYVLRADENPERAANAIMGTFRVGRDRYQQDTMAGIYLAATPTESPEMRHLGTSGVNYGATLHSDTDVDSEKCLLVGVRQRRS